MTLPLSPGRFFLCLAPFRPSLQILSIAVPQKAPVANPSLVRICLIVQMRCKQKQQLHPLDTFPLFVFTPNQHAKRAYVSRSRTTKHPTRWSSTLQKKLTRRTATKSGSSSHKNRRLVSKTLEKNIELRKRCMVQICPCLEADTGGLRQH